MPNTRSARKRVRQAERNRLRNKMYKTRIKTAIRRLEEALTGGDPTAIQEALRRAVSAIDRAAVRGAIHRNTAARKKSRLMQRLKKLGVVA
ncbi:MULTISPECIES: 30S ribosomal protein S20 [Thermaerobacter]|uniref:Small ribosomal subunit protein bS20 n=1 Tax=Thermaerobacter composti TaxID=554949 RepID=A0ABZ0QQY2_9FIRM|nr:MULTISPECIES: 30S ribosomal protein S20 [Thermaerobacter]PZN03572.1 MAG: 30S ribosomal protein S20 [Bacillota bacterium]QBS36940.1 30S ribosomal protein S20 [Thermaerobacter sp. FW80]WPD18937.1 30S ribosomal protein S20 [Thermaerobacter composti]